MRRLFVGIDISDRARAVIAAYIASVRPVFWDVEARWSRPENLHITLKFLGETDDARIPELCTAIRSITSRSRIFSLKLAENFSVNKKTPAIRIDDSSGLAGKIAGSLAAEFTKLGFQKELREFNPHITVARLHGGNEPMRLINRHTQTSLDPIVFEVREIFLYERETRQTGSVYKKLKRFRLGRPD